MVPLSFAPTVPGDQRAAIEVEQELSGTNLNVQTWYAFDPAVNTAQSRSTYVFQSTVATILGGVSGNKVNGDPTITPLDISIIEVKDLVPIYSSLSRQRALQLGTAAQAGEEKVYGVGAAQGLSQSRSLQDATTSISVKYVITFYPATMTVTSPQAGFQRILNQLQATVINTQQFTLTLRRLAEENSNTLLRRANATDIENSFLVKTAAPTTMATAEPTPEPSMWPTPAPTATPTESTNLLSKTNIIIVSVVLVFFAVFCVFVYFACCKREAATKIIMVRRPSQRPSIAQHNPIYANQQRPPGSNLHGGLGYQGPMEEDPQDAAYPSPADLAYGHGQSAYQNNQGPGLGGLERGSGGSRASFSRSSIGSVPNVMQAMQARRLSGAASVAGTEFSGDYGGGHQKHLPADYSNL